MEAVSRFQSRGSAQIRQELVKAGVNKQFVAELDDAVAKDLLKGVTYLLQTYAERLD